MEAQIVYEFRPEDYGQEFWQQCRGEKAKSKIVVYKRKGEYLLCLDMRGRLFPRWEALASLVKFACMVERANTGNIEALKRAFRGLGMDLEDREPTLLREAP